MLHHLLELNSSRQFLGMCKYCVSGALLERESQEYWTMTLSAGQMTRSFSGEGTIIIFACLAHANDRLVRSFSRLQPFDNAYLVKFIAARFWSAEISSSISLNRQTRSVLGSLVTRCQEKHAHQVDI